MIEDIFIWGLFGFLSVLAAAFAVALIMLVVGA